MKIAVKVWYSKKSNQTLRAVGILRDDNSFDALSFKDSHVLEVLDIAPSALLRLGEGVYGVSELRKVEE